eukprot:3527048-Amphidinium_carterae.2
MGRTASATVGSLAGLDCDEFQCISQGQSELVKIPAEDWRENLSPSESGLSERGGHGSAAIGWAQVELALPPTESCSVMAAEEAWAGSAQDYLQHPERVVDKPEKNLERHMAKRSRSSDGGLPKWSQGGRTEIDHESATGELGDPREFGYGLPTMARMRSMVKPWWNGIWRTCDKAEIST